MDKHLNILIQLMLLKWDMDNKYNMNNHNGWVKWYITSYFIDE